MIKSSADVMDVLSNAPHQFSGSDFDVIEFYPQLGFCEPRDLHRFPHIDLGAGNVILIMHLLCTGVF